MSLSSKPICALAGKLLFTGALLVGVTGCTATVTAQPARTAVLYDYPVVYVDEVPTRIYENPSANYRGRPAYLVGTRWYYRSDRGWVYFREEPSELRTARTTHRYRRVESTPARRPAVEQRRRRVVEEPTQTRQRNYD
jgi:hypothetical protein